VSELISDPERARRLARVLFSDIVIYAGDEVRIGLEKDDLLDRLHGEIERARDYYRRRVDPALVHAERIFDFALVDVLVGAHRKVSTPIW
jgi:hypothetical protein